MYFPLSSPFESGFVRTEHHPAKGLKIEYSLKLVNCTGDLLTLPNT